MTPAEKRQISILSGKLKGEIILKLRCTADSRSDTLREFGLDLAALVPAIRISEFEGEAQELPAFELAPNLHFAGLPLARELPPFMEMLAALREGRSPSPDPYGPGLAAISLPAAIDLFVASGCSHCPESVRQLYPLALANSAMGVNIVDGTLFTERADEVQLKAVPTVIIDDRFRWSGKIVLEEILDFLQTRNPSSLGAASLESMLKEGKATRLAAMMCEAGCLFPAFLELLTHAKWPVRLGAMVALEELLQKDPALAAEAEDPLWTRFAQVSDAVKGDILYLMGELGGRKARQRLASVSSGPYSPAVREAAAEALSGLSH